MSTYDNFVLSMHRVFRYKCGVSPKYDECEDIIIERLYNVQIQEQMFHFFPVEYIFFICKRLQIIIFNLQGKEMTELDTDKLSRFALLGKF